MRQVLVLTLLVAAAGCSRKHDVSVENELEPGAPVTVLFWGEPLATSTAPAVVAKVPAGNVRRADPRGYNTTACVLPGCNLGEAPSSFLLARIETRACGAVDLCVGFDDTKTVLPSGQPYRGRALWRKRTKFDLCTEEVARIFVDNRGGAAHVVSVGGGAKHDIAANATAVVEVPAPPCASLAAVSLDGTVVGTLHVYGEDPDYQTLGPRDFVIDPAASHCYASTTWSYTPGGGSSGGGDPNTQWLEKKSFHALERRVDVPFLEKAPEQIDTYAGYGQRTSLVEMPCSP